MTDTRITDRAVDDLRIADFFDPNAAFNHGTKTEVSLVSHNGYELVLQGDDFAYDKHNAPTDGEIHTILLYDPNGNLVGEVDGANASLVDYYDQVAVHGHSGAFAADLMSGDDSVSGGAANDHLEGYVGADTISGGDGDDILVGGKGDDHIFGGAGFDDIDAGKGDDVVSGGKGDDLIYGFDGDDKLYGDAGYDSIAGESGDDSLYGGSGNDKLEGGGGKDQVYGQKDDDVLGGGSKADHLNGGAGDDRLYGDSGADVLKGGKGADSISGGGGDDNLSGGTGHDVLFGGGGADQFHFDKLSDGADTVQDFAHGVDTLAFDASGFDGMSADFQLVVGSDPMASGAKGAFLFDTDSHQLFWDGDGKGGADAQLVAKLDDVTTLTKDDFVIG